MEELKGFRDSVSKVLIKNYQIIGSCIDGTVRTFDVRMGEITIDEFLRKLKIRLWDICFFFLEPIANFAMSNDGK